MISFPSLATSYSAVVGSTAPSINALTTSTDGACVVDASSYVLNGAMSGISLDSDGTTTVSMTSAFALNSLSTSITTNGGAETHTSSPFSVEVQSCLPLIKFPNFSP